MISSIFTRPSLLKRSYRNFLTPTRLYATQQAVAETPWRQSLQEESQTSTSDYIRDQQAAFEPPSNPRGVTGILSNWVHGVQLTDLSTQLIERTKHILLDGIGCALIAAQLPWSRVATESVLKLEGVGNCTVIGWEKKISPLSAALLNSTYIQGFELDDVHKDAPWHACSIIIPALFAAIEQDTRSSSSQKQHSGQSFLLSTIIGFELGGRIGRALHGTDMLSRGWHSGAVFGAPAAAAAVSKQLGSSPRQIEDALGTACTQACGLMSAQYEAAAKRMQHGFAARNGLFAALLAKDNYTGIDQVFEREYGGYLDMFSQGTKLTPQHKPSELVGGLGVDWSSLRNISIKPYASMAGTHGPTDCILSLQEKFPARFSDLTRIKKIRVVQHNAWYGHGGQDLERPVNVLGAQMSTKYCVAAQLIDKAVLPEQFTAANLNRDEIWGMIDKVECEGDASLDASRRWETQLKVHYDDGTVLEEESAGPRTTHYPLSNQEIVEKWRVLANSCIDDARMARIEELVLNIENLTDTTELIQEMEGLTRCSMS